MSFCHQAPFEAVGSSVFVFLSLVYPATAYCFSSRWKIDESPSLVIHQTWELFSHWIHQSFRFARFGNSLRLTLVVQGVCEWAASPSSWSWSILAWVKSAVDLLSLGPWGAARESSSLAGVGSKELECVNSSSRQRSWIWFSSVERILHRRPSQLLLLKQLCFVGPKLWSQINSNKNSFCWSFL